MNNTLRPHMREKIQTMSSLIRYNNAIHIHDENVAEHSFYVALYTIAICDTLRISLTDKLLALQLAIIHDVHEIELSDIPHNVKMQNTALNTICIGYEETFNQRVFPDIMDNYNDLNAENRIDLKTIVELADVLSVLQYSDQELQFNNKRFAKVKESAVNRIRGCLEVLEGMYGKDEINNLIFEIFNN